MLKTKKLRKVLGEKLKEHITLREFTTMKVGGVADYFFEAKNIEDIISAVMAARADKVPFHIIGWASNIIVSDFGYPGLIIRNKSNNISYLPDKSQVIADSGVDLSRLILYAINQNLGGMEKLYGIPGSIGGAIYGNAGAYRQEISDFIKSVTLLSPNNKIVSKDKKWLETSYRSTRLKRSSKNEYIILTVKFQFAHNKKEQMLDNISKIKQERNKRLAGLGPSAGSIFKNPMAGKDYKTIEMAKQRSAGYLLDEAGVKKMSVGDAGVFEKHANIIENKGNANSRDIRLLIEKMRDSVRENSGVELEEEVEYVGQWE